MGDYLTTFSNRGVSFPVKTILVPIDFSRISRRVVAQAVKLGEATGAGVVLLHSVPPPPIIASDVAPMAAPALLLSDEGQKAADLALRRMQRGLQQRGITVETICTRGAPVSQIVAFAERLGATHIVIGSHGHTAFYDLVVGGTTSGVLKRASCPVVVVPPGRKRSEPHSRGRRAKTNWGRTTRRMAVAKRERALAHPGASHSRAHP